MRRNWIFVAIWAGLIFLGSCLPGASVSEASFVDFVAHKTVHIFEYAVLAILLLRALQFQRYISVYSSEGGRRKKLGAIVGVVLALCFLYGLSDEWHQSFVPGREAKLRDAFIDLLGGGFGVLLLWSLPRKTSSGPAQRDTKTAQETFELGKDFSKSIKPGMPVFLYGGLGAGKTEFIKGVCSGLGYKGRVLSPTFQLVREYKCPGTVSRVYHIDLYRLEEFADIQTIGLEDYLADKEAVVLLEWADRLKRESLPKPRVEVRIEILSENRRKFAIMRV